MATIQEAIKRLRYEFVSTGAEKVAADLNKVNQATAAVTATSTVTEKAQLSLDKQLTHGRRVSQALGPSGQPPMMQAAKIAAVAQALRVA